MKNLVPKNGRFPVALLAGGPADIGREVRERLAERMGVLVVEHREYGRRGFGSHIPLRIDLVIVLKDMISHPEQDLIVGRAKAQGVPFVRTQRKWATMSQALRAAGVQSVGPLPAEVVARNKMFEPEAEVTVAPVAPVTPAPVAAPAVELDLRKRVTAHLLEMQAWLPAGVALLAEITRDSIEVSWHE